MSTPPTRLPDDAQTRLFAAAATADKERALAVLTGLDRIPDRDDAFDPLEWDAQGLPE